MAKQWFFWKLMSFGLLNIDLGPIIKLFYMGPYASKYFNLNTLSSSLIHFVKDVTTASTKSLQANVAI